MQAQDLYAWIADTARFIKSATFHPVKATRDATTRINVQLHDKNRVFIVASRNSNNLAVTPAQVADHFHPGFICPVCNAQGDRCTNEDGSNMKVGEIHRGRGLKMEGIDCMACGDHK